MCGYGQLGLNLPERLRLAAECCFLTIILLRCGDTLMDEAHGRLATSGIVCSCRVMDFDAVDVL